MNLKSGTYSDHDAIIIGAGPAGCNCALHLAGAGIKTLVIEKSKDFREKICGGGISYKALRCLERTNKQLIEKFYALPDKQISNGALFYTPSGIKMELKTANEKFENDRAGYFIKRGIFDAFLRGEMSSDKNITFITGEKVLGFETGDEGAVIQCRDGAFRAKLLIFADGINSLIMRENRQIHRIRKNFVYAARGYFKQKTGTDLQDSLAEFHFTKEVSPGYCWLFPLPDGLINAGFYIQSGMASGKKNHADELFQTIIQSNRQLKERFENLDQIERIKNGVLPLWNRHHILYGNRILVAGDAAALVDPFSGEGIANALLSGELAALQAIAAFQLKDFSARQLREYKTAVYRVMYPEIRASKRLLDIIRHPWLFDYIARKTIQIHDYEYKMGSIYYDVEKRIRVTRPSRIIRLLIKKQ